MAGEEAGAGARMKLTGSTLIALAILLASIVLAMGSRYQIVPSAHATGGGTAFKLDRFTGGVTVCDFSGCSVLELVN